MVLFLIAALTMTAGLLALPHSGEMSEAMQSSGAASEMSHEGMPEPSGSAAASANDCADMPCTGDHDPLTPCIIVLMCTIAAIILSLLIPLHRAGMIRIARSELPSSRTLMPPIPAPPDSLAPRLTVLSISRT